MSRSSEGPESGPGAPKSGSRRPRIKIQDYVRRHTNPVKLRTLSDHGFQQVNLITLKKVNRLIQNAVEQTFDKYQSSLDQVGREKIESEVSRRLLSGLKDLRRGSGKTRAAKTEASPPTADGESPRSEPETGQVDSGPTGGLTEARQVIRPAVVTRDGAPTPSRPPRLDDWIDELKPRLKRFLSDCLEEERQQMGLRGDRPTRAFLERLDAGIGEILEEAFEKERNREFDAEKSLAEAQNGLLERRLDKLKQELLQMEVTLEKMSRERSIDPGLASIYQEVQGLNQVDENYECKKGLLQGIFEANLKIQSRA